MKTYRVALHFNMSRIHQQGIVRGVLGYGRMRGNWRFYGAFLMLEQVGNFRNWDGDGIIAAVESRADARLLARSGLPVVDIAEAISHPCLSLVTNDNMATGAVAARHFQESGIANFAYCGMEGIIWADKRRRGFAAEIGTKERRLSAFHREPEWWQAAGNSSEFAKFLQSLPKPLGVLAGNDAVAVKTVEACRLAGLTVPDEVAVIGVDDEDLLCELSSPTLSSIPFNRRELGFRAAERLDALMRGLIPAMPPFFVPPLPAVRRASSDIFHVSDPLVMKALSIIRERARDPVGVGDVAALAFASRRNLERRFRRKTGRSILEELHRVRVGLAERLLSESDLPLSKIAALCGFPSLPRFNAIFHRNKGCAPAAFRLERNTAAGDGVPA